MSPARCPPWSSSNGSRPLPYTNSPPDARAGPSVYARRMTDVTTLAYTPATTLVENIRTRRLSPVEVLDDVLERAERLQPSVHAFVTLDAERARDAARAAEAAVMRGDPLGALHGLPVSVKDLE